MGLKINASKAACLLQMIWHEMILCGNMDTAMEQATNICIFDHKGMYAGCKV